MTVARHFESSWLSTRGHEASCRNGKSGAHMPSRPLQRRQDCCLITPPDGLSKQADGRGASCRRLTSSRKTSSG